MAGFQLGGFKQTPHWGYMSHFYCSKLYPALVQWPRLRELPSPGLVLLLELAPPAPFMETTTCTHIFMYIIMIVSLVKQVSGKQLYKAVITFF